MEGEPVGRGHDRYYAFEEVVHVASLAFIAPHMRYGGLMEARPLAQQLADAIKQVFASGPDGDYVDRYPLYVLVYDDAYPKFVKVDGARAFRRVAAEYRFRGAVLVAPGDMALALMQGIENALTERQSK